MEAHLLHIAREGLYLALLLAAPPVLASLLVGLVTGALQTATQIQDATLSAAPRIAAAALALVIAGPWIAEQLTAFAAALLASLPVLAH